MESQPVVRIWEGRVPRERADEYTALMRSTGLVDYRATPGNRGAWVLRRDEGDATHVTMLTIWDSLDAVRAFAGDPVDRARYYDFDADYLLELPETVTHYAVASELGTPMPAVDSGEAPDLIGAACTLEGDDLRTRLEEWRALRDRAVSIDSITGGLRLVFPAGEPVAAVAHLVERESECCDFYRFALRVDGTTRILEVSAGPAGEPAVRALLGLDGSPERGPSAEG